MATPHDGTTATEGKAHSRFLPDKLARIAQTLDELTKPGLPLTSDAAGILHREADALRALAAEIRLHLESGQLIAKLSRQLLNVSLDELRYSIVAALAELGKLFGAQRTYVVLLSDERCLAEAHEWCAEGIVGHDFDAFSAGSIDDACPWSMQQFLRGETVLVENPGTLPLEAAAERSACESLGTLAYVNMPLFLDGALVGWLGFDSLTERKRWAEEELHLIALAGDIIINVVQRKHRKDLLCQQRELDERVTSMSTQTAELVHQLYSATSIVSGSLSLLMDQLPPPGTVGSLDRSRDMLDIACEAADRASSLARDLRALPYRAETEIQSVDTRAVIDTVLRTIPDDLRARIVCNYENVPPVLAIAYRLEQVLRNLVCNAVSALRYRDSADNQITVAAQAIDDDWVEITIADTGYCIEPEVLALIAAGPPNAPFFGLARALVSSFGGTLDVESKPNQGTIIRLTVRRASSAAQ